MDGENHGKPYLNGMIWGCFPLFLGWKHTHMLVLGNSGSFWRRTSSFELAEFQASLKSSSWPLPRCWWRISSDTWRVDAWSILWQLLGGARIPGIVRGDRITPIYKPWKGHLEGEQPHLVPLLWVWPPSQDAIVANEGLGWKFPTKNVTKSWWSLLLGGGHTQKILLLGYDHSKLYILQKKTRETHQTDTSPRGFQFGVHIYHDMGSLWWVNNLKWMYPP